MAGTDKVTVRTETGVASVAESPDHHDPLAPYRVANNQQAPKTNDGVPAKPYDPAHPLNSLPDYNPTFVQKAEGGFTTDGRLNRQTRKLFYEAEQQDNLHRKDKGFHSAVDELIAKINKDLKSHYWTLRREGSQHIETVPTDKRNKDGTWIAPLYRYDPKEYEWGHKHGQ